MLHIAPQDESAQGALWLTLPDSQKWNWIVQALPQLVRRVTKEYLKWYIDKFNDFIDRLIAPGKLMQ